MESRQAVQDWRRSAPAEWSRVSLGRWLNRAPAGSPAPMLSVELARGDLRHSACSGMEKQQTPVLDVPACNDPGRRRSALCLALMTASCHPGHLGHLALPLSALHHTTSRGCPCGRGTEPSLLLQALRVEPAQALTLCWRCPPVLPSSASVSGSPGLRHPGLLANWRQVNQPKKY